MEILQNEPYEDEKGKGQYTKKLYHLGSKMPSFMDSILPGYVKVVQEEAWNAFPKCTTGNKIEFKHDLIYPQVYKSEYMGESFEITVETLHAADNGRTWNIHGLPDSLLEQLEVVQLDIATRNQDDTDYAEENEPSLFSSELTGRGPLVGEWTLTTKPMMTCYKLVSAKFEVFGLQTIVENSLHSWMATNLLKLHKDIFCSIDEWFGLTMEDIRRMEKEVQAELASKMENYQDQIDDDE